MSEITTAPVASSTATGDVVPVIRTVAGVPTLYQIAASALQGPQGPQGPAGAVNVLATAISIAGATSLAASAAGDVAYDVTLTGNATLTPTGAPAGIMRSIIVRLHANGFAPSFAATVQWPGGVPPTFNQASGAYDVVQLVTWDGISWLGILVAASVAAPTLPSAPVNVSAIAGNNQVVIGATGVIASPAVTSYNVRRGTTPGGEASLPVGLAVVLPWTDTTAVNGTVYYYTVTANNALGESLPSAEVSAVPSSTAGTGHHATLTGTTSYIYTPDQAAFNPVANPFSYRVRCSPSSATGQNNQALIGVYQVGATAVSETLLYLKSDGTLHVAWVNAAGVVCDVGSPAAVPFNGSTPLWCRADVAPATGVVQFWLSSDGQNWVQLGATQQAATYGALAAGTVSSSLILGETSANGIEYTGDIYEAQLIINGVVVAHPVCGPTTTTDATGAIWITSPTGVTYS